MRKWVGGIGSGVIRTSFQFGWINATLDRGGTSALSTWRVKTTLAPGFVTLQARATAPELGVLRHVGAFPLADMSASEKR